MNESSEIILKRSTQNPTRVKSYIQQGSSEASARQLVARDLTLTRVRRDINKEKQETKKYEELAERYGDLSLTDALTGLYNRRFLDGDGERAGILESVLKIAKRGEDPISVVMMDMDNLKQVNDGYGHQAGDVMIKSIAKEISDNIRDSDFAIRYGGDEIFLILPVTDEKGAAKLTEEIRTKINNLDLSISSGVVSLKPNKSLITPKDLVDAADGAMYQAKQHGKNQTWVAKEQEVKNGKIVFSHTPLVEIKS